MKIAVSQISFLKVIKGHGDHRFFIRCVVDHVNVQLAHLDVLLVSVVFIKNVLARLGHISRAYHDLLGCSTDSEQVNLIDNEGLP